MVRAGAGGPICVILFDGAFARIRRGTVRGATLDFRIFACFALRVVGGFVVDTGPLENLFSCARHRIANILSSVV